MYPNSTSPVLNQRVPEVHGYVGSSLKPFRLLGLDEQIVVSEGPNTSTYRSTYAHVPSTRNGAIIEGLDLSVAPRVPQNFPPAHHDPGLWSHTPRPRATHKLSSVASLTSLRSQTSNDTIQKKRKRFLPFRKNIEASWKEDRESQATVAENIALPNTFAPHVVDHIDISNLTVEVPHLPVALKPAAAKRLDLRSRDETNTSQSFTASPGKYSNTSRAPYSELLPALTEANGSHVNFSLHLASTERNMKSSNSNASTFAAEESFYLSSSDSETEEDDQLSSPYSCRSSHTSYNISGSIDGEFRKSHERLRDLLDQRATNVYSSTPASSHQTQNSVSSFGSQRKSSPPSSRSNSFSRPLIRPSSQNHGVPPSLSAISSEGEIDQLPQLTSIKEDSPPSTEAPDEATKPSNTGKIANRVIPSSPKRRIRLPPNPTPGHGHNSSKISEPARKPQEPSLELLNWPKPSKSFSTHEKTKGIQKLTNPAELDRRSARPLSLAITGQSEAFLSSQSAEVIILQIFENLESFHDLFACARLNQGFYKVFKRHELRLMKNALRNMSPAQWELREASPKEIIPVQTQIPSDYTPRTYIQFHKRDTYTLKALKSLMFNRCRKLLRSETVQALNECDSDRSKRVDDTLWRIWTFCTIFGADKGSENDEKAQTLWLCGASQGSRPTTARSSRSKASEQRPACASTPESFGRGNYGGLTADELYDMLEAWNCIRDILKSVFDPSSRTHARKYGVVGGTAEGKVTVPQDLLTEEVEFDEWIHYLATLGPPTVVDLAQHATPNGEEVFFMAEDMGWTIWPRPSAGESRARFFQHVVENLYNKKVEEAKGTSMAEIQAKRKSRGLELAAELREEKTRSMMPRDALAQHDQSIGLWLEWMARAEGVPLAAPSAAADRPSPPKRTEEEPRAAPRERRANSQLSIFPPQYTKGIGATPRGSPLPTPMRSRTSSRAGSISQPAKQTMRPVPKLAANQAAIPETNSEERGESSKQQVFLPKLSTCPEA